jgi:hypothetical protein
MKNVELNIFLKSGFWWFWNLATLGGFLFSLLLIEVGEKQELGAIEGTIGGAVIGLFQSLVISRILPQTWLWILVNLLGWGLMGGSGFGTLGWFVPSSNLLPLRLVTGIFLGTIGGTWLGIWQWLVMRKYFSEAWRWIAFNSLIWSIGLPLGWFLGGIIRSVTHLFLAEIMGLSVTWSLVGTMTGLLFLRLVGEEKLSRWEYSRSQPLD